VYQKLEPDNDTSRTDYLQLANGINEGSSTTVRRNTVFDQLDLPEVINDLAGSRWCSENDDVWANMSMYRDTFGDQLWRKIPFDMNASWGQRYGGITPLDATLDSCKSHPLYGGSGTPACDGPAAPNNFNRLYDVIIALPETRQMLLRRQRSIMDQMIQPPGTPAESLIIENYIKYMTNLISVEANMDRAKWASRLGRPARLSTPASAICSTNSSARAGNIGMSLTLSPTRAGDRHRQRNNAGIPLSQPASAALAVIGVEFNPTGGNQDQEFVCISNPAPFAVDISDGNSTAACSSPSRRHGACRRTASLTSRQHSAHSGRAQSARAVAGLLFSVRTKASFRRAVKR
jgi:hypothetical protein